MDYGISLSTILSLLPDGAVSSAVSVLLSIPVVGDVLIRVALFLWCFWGLYVLVMGVYRAHLSGRLSRTGYWLGVPWVVIGYLVDVLANLTVASLVFAQLPREMLVTTRMQKIIANQNEKRWRRAIAQWVCDELLDIFDPTGNHC